mgnify:CR=1 FL=1
MPVAEWGRVVPARWTCSAVATRGSVDAFPGAVLVGVETVADRLGLVRRVECLGQSEARRSPSLRATDAIASVSARAAP